MKSRFSINQKMVPKKSFGGFTIHKATWYAGPINTLKPAPSKSVTTLNKRLECTEGGSNKFWEVHVIDNGVNRLNGYQFNVSVKYGKINTKGMQSVKDFNSAKACSAFVTDKINEKLAKGYVEVGASGVTAAPAALPPPVTKATIMGLKAEVAQTAEDLLGELPLGAQAEVIVTIIIGGEVIQETRKK